MWSPILSRSLRSGSAMMPTFSSSARNVTTARSSSSCSLRMTTSPWISYAVFCLKKKKILEDMMGHRDVLVERLGGRRVGLVGEGDGLLGRGLESGRASPHP